MLGCLSLLIAKHLISKLPPHLFAFFTPALDLQGLFGLLFILHSLFDLPRGLAFLQKVDPLVYPRRSSCLWNTLVISRPPRRVFHSGNTWGPLIVAMRRFRPSTRANRRRGRR